jgi:hypothetical protein
MIKQMANLHIVNFLDKLKEIPKKNVIILIKRVKYYMKAKKNPKCGVEL